MEIQRSDGFVVQTGKPEGDVSGVVLVVVVGAGVCSAPDGSVVVLVVVVGAGVQRSDGSVVQTGKPEGDVSSGYLQC